jgi:NADPH-dependent curcumin reductase CurA
MSSNTQVIYLEVPQGLPNPTKTFQVNKVPFDPKKVELAPNHLLVKTLYLSVDPYMRARMRDPKIQSYFPAALPGTPFSGGAIVEVLKSSDPKIKIGQVLVGFAPWEEYSVIPSMSPMGPVTPIPSPKDSKVPISYYLGVLGMPGITAYSGLHKICEPLTKGQTIYVSAASGAVGQVVGQYAKALGLRVVGSAGSDDKVLSLNKLYNIYCAYLVFFMFQVEFLLKQLKFDEAFNYKKYPDLPSLISILKKTCPDGIDIYFENVGGKMLEAVLEVANNFARIAVCGMISQYKYVLTNEMRVHEIF